MGLIQLTCILIGVRYIALHVSNVDVISSSHYMCGRNVDAYNIIVIAYLFHMLSKPKCLYMIMYMYIVYDCSISSELYSLCMYAQPMINADLLIPEPLQQLTQIQFNAYQVYTCTSCMYVCSLISTCSVK